MYKEAEKRLGRKVQPIILWQRGQNFYGFDPFLNCNFLTIPAFHLMNKGSFIFINKRRGMELTVIGLNHFFKEVSFLRIDT